MSGERVVPLLPLVIAMDVALASLASSPAAATEAAVLAELNRARADPAAFVQSLRDWRSYYRGRLVVRPTSSVAFRTTEGVQPVDEAIRFVQSRDRSEPLEPAPMLTRAAAEHRSEQGADGSIGHIGQSGSTPAQRLERQGGDRYVGEVIAYGTRDPLDVIRQLVVDDGVRDRSHRRLLFDRSLRYAGVACGAHPTLGHMCVITVGRSPDGLPLARTGRTIG